MIQIKDLDFCYPGQQLLFDSLSLNLETGSITGLLGRNGAGKTSLLKLITGTMHLKSGEISVLDHKPGKREVSLLSDVYFVPEEFYFPSVTINNYVRATSPFYPKFDHELLFRTLVEFEIRPDCNLQTFSYGQKKKFLIAFALATRCRLLIFDEPTNGLDIPSKSIFRKIVAGSLDENQLVVISTHQVKDIENLIDKIIILDNGKVIFKKTITEISQKVRFISGGSGDVDGAIYSEPVPGGFRLVMPNEDKETEVDIELLFNAVTKGNKIE
jgi:ABC-2 type transport system ATP-binding protein